MACPFLLAKASRRPLTAMQATGCPGWASLGTSGLKAADLPDGVKDVILLGENDGGKSAKAIAKVAPDLKQKGIRVRVAYAAGGLQRLQRHGDGRSRSGRGLRGCAQDDRGRPGFRRPARRPR